MMKSILDLIYDPNLSILLFLVVAGLIIRQSLVFVGQIWANTYHHLATYLLLPGIAFVITKIIKQDIALSLGMIGALSIVRFRTPIKEPEELLYLFLSIGLGVGFAAGQILLTILVFIALIINSTFPFYL